MPGFDDRLSRELDRAARPADPGGAFEAIERRLARRHRLRRMQAAALTVVVLAGTVGGVLVLERAFRPATANLGGASSTTPAPTPSPSPKPTPTGPVDIGLAFPVCDLRTASADLDGNGSLDTITVATKMSDVGGCPARGTATEVLTVDLNGDGKADTSAGPLACPSGCEPFATPDLDGDGRPDIALRVERAADGTDRIQLFRVSIGGGGAVRILPFADAAGNPSTFTWGTDGTNIYGVSCTATTNPPLVTEWQAMPTGPGSYTVSERGYQVVGSTLRSAFENSYDVPGEQPSLPDGGGETMCGASVAAR